MVARSGKAINGGIKAVLAEARIVSVDLRNKSKNLNHNFLQQRKVPYIVGGYPLLLSSMSETQYHASVFVRCSEADFLSLNWAYVCSMCKVVLSPKYCKQYHCS